MLTQLLVAFHGLKECYTPIPHRPRIARIATNCFFYLFGGIREVSLNFFYNRDALRVSPDSDTMSLRIFGGIGSFRLESRKNSLRLSIITLEHVARKLRNQLRIS